MKKQEINLKIKALYPNLSIKEQKIANYILKKPQAVIHGTISNISETVEVADATVFRFCKRLGFKGFQDFKIALASENVDAALTIHENITTKDTELTMAQKVFDANIQSLKDTQQLLQETNLQQASQYLNAAGKISFLGVGGSSIIAMDAYHKFLRTPLHCLYTQDSHLQMMQAARLTDKDCAVVISHSGITKDALQLAGIAKEKNAKLIVVTSYSLSPLAKMADVLLLSAAEETEYRSEALTSRISQLSLMDALFVMVMFQNGEASSSTLEEVRRVISSTKL